jgi:hypothetical protein
MSVFLATVGFAVLAGVGNANATKDQCTGNNVLCFWKDAEYRGGIGKVSARNDDFRVFPKASCPSGTWNDCISSVYNKTGYCARLYYGYGATGSYQNLTSYDAYDDLSYNPSALNDQISSNRFVNLCPLP